MIRNATARRAVTLGGLILIALLLMACSSRRATAYQYNWDIFFDSLFRPDPRILRGLALTIAVAIAAQLIGVVLGVLGALGRLSKLRLARWLSGVYIWIFMGTPLLVQLMIVYYGLLNTNITGVAYTPGPINLTDVVGTNLICCVAYVDDDPVSRGSLLSEFWDTPHGFIA